jgi:hypothetical protein
MFFYKRKKWVLRDMLKCSPCLNRTINFILVQTYTSFTLKNVSLGCFFSYKALDFFFKQHRCVFSSCISLLENNFDENSVAILDTGELFLLVQFTQRYKRKTDKVYCYSLTSVG